MKKKICVVTGSRAEYGLLYPLMKKIQQVKEFGLQIIATGMHLSPEFGLTYKQIIDDGFQIDDTVEMLLSSDTPVGISKSVGLGIISFAESLKKAKPDILIILGDRFESFSAAVVAHIMRIPIAHIAGGELTAGAIDDAFRHSITKMSHLHFVSTEEYRKRVIQLGENPNRVYNVGALGLDNIKSMQLLSKVELEKKFRFKFGPKNLLVTFHPVTLDNNPSEKQFKELLRALDRFKDVKILFTMPNADTNGRIIIQMINKYIENNAGRCKAFVSMGTLKYLSTIKYVDAVVGNSSSGIIEVPSFGKPTVNIGNRQAGRVKAASVIDCSATTDSIASAIEKALSKDFQDFCKTVKNPYGNGTAAEQIVSVLKEILKKPISLRKEFYDIYNWEVGENYDLPR